MPPTQGWVMESCRVAAGRAPHAGLSHARRSGRFGVLRTPSFQPRRDDHDANSPPRHPAVGLAPVAGAADDSGPLVTKNTAREAVERGLRIVQKAAASYPSHRSCFSCHHQTLPIFAGRGARAGGRDRQGPAPGAGRFQSQVVPGAHRVAGAGARDRRRGDDRRLRPLGARPGGAQAQRRHRGDGRVPAQDPAARARGTGRSAGAGRRWRSRP
jgi:hypothetical protein